MIRLFTKSRLSTFQTCKLKHFYRYDLRRSLIDSDDAPLRFGSLWHDHGQQVYWQTLSAGGDCGDALEAATRAIVGSGADQFEIAKCLALLDGYHFRWLRDTTSWRVVAVEVEFRIPLINPDTLRPSRKFELAGKIDLIIELLNGEHAGLYNVEHKTSSEDIKPGAMYWRRLRLDDQLSIYHDGARSLGYDIRGTIYDVAGRPRHEPALATPEDKRSWTNPKPERPGKPCIMHKAEAKALAKETGVKLLVADIPYSPECGACTPPKPAEPSRLYSGQRETDELATDYYARVGAAISADPDAFYRRTDPPVVRLEDELVRMRRNHWHVAQEMVVDARAPYHPQTHASCDAYHKMCEFFDVCTGDAQIDDPTKYVRREKFNPELSDNLQTTTESSSHDSNTAADPEHGPAAA